MHVMMLSIVFHVSKITMWKLVRNNEERMKINITPRALNQPLKKVLSIRVELAHNLIDKQVGGTGKEKQTTKAINDRNY